MMELLVAVSIAGIVAASAMPSTRRTLADLRLHGDARGVHNAVGLAKMRAAARYSRVRIYVDLTDNSYHLEYWDKTAGDWTREVDPTVKLQQGVTFGYGSLTTPPSNTQSAIGQSGACRTKTGTAISGTACIVFNSRGIPLDGSGNVTGESALYVTDGTGIYGVTLSATPLVRLWWTKASGATWIQR
jgi:Tfp pilus assembly protein FimT